VGESDKESNILVIFNLKRTQILEYPSNKELERKKVMVVIRQVMVVIRG
jgi:hypothetical protein